ncbi:hypothetical protein V5O48_011820 [Marasmius crinis-equi]|uniref:Yeast cell wall synthesis Kre9/Knh1-like N-terminal domain-containing protein n=1 Tax=Marasmius crinis-equi TaxID=585013 RepID=A0ABR3F4J8_9AGAR
MQFKASAIASVLAFFATSSVASPLQARKALDVWSPKILTPNANTVWVVGTTVNVTWDTTDAPVNISNGAAVQLRKGNGPAPIDDPYLKPVRSFDLRTGWVEVTVPETPAGKDYLIDLFGDSGNWSEEFEIAEAQATIGTNAEETA